MALAQCASCFEGIVHRRQQSCPLRLRVTILEIVNIPVLRFVHSFFPSGERTAIHPHVALHLQPYLVSRADFARLTVTYSAAANECRRRNVTSRTQQEKTPNAYGWRGSRPSVPLRA